MLVEQCIEAGLRTERDSKNFKFPKCKNCLKKEDGHLV